MGIETLALAGIAAGTALQVQGTLEEGKQAEEIAKARADIDIANAEATRKASVEKAKIKGERGRKLIETQKSAAAAGGIRINVGSPLVIEAQTRADIAKDIGFSLETGRVEEQIFRSSAALEIAQGKALKKKSKFDALAQGLQGFGSVATLGIPKPGVTPTATSGSPAFGFDINKFNKPLLP